MDGVGISIVERPRPLRDHDTPNANHNTSLSQPLKCEEPRIYNPSDTNYCGSGLKCAIMAP